MKTGIHPKLFKVEVKCSCGNTFVTRSAREIIHPTLCSSCHPLFTGQQKYIDTAGRIEKFQKKFSK
ncbi:50S ribosomal protein L31 [candidate division TM6 bacterium RIFCSPHIGHO2_12_FULL_38_8]|nr:MAG: 50S ribosomal protein L31 [candidate division TM6 bacterium RIFCSPHIGHO2_12_FULL_38_8]